MSSTNTAREAKETVMQKVSQGEVDKLEDYGEPPARKPLRVQASSSLESVFDERADEQHLASLSTAPTGASVQLETY